MVLFDFFMLFSVEVIFSYFCSLMVVGLIYHIWIF